MHISVAKSMLLDHRQDYNRDRLPWLPQRLYRLFAETKSDKTAKL